MKKESKKVKVYISYSRHDAEYKEQLVEHLNELAAQKKYKDYLTIYHDGKLSNTEDFEVWDKDLRDNLSTSQVVLFLLSPNFVKAKYANHVEARMAMDMRRRDEAVVVPVLVKPTDFSSLPFNVFQAVPTKGSPVAIAEDREKAWKTVIQDLIPVFEGVRNGSIQLQPSAPETYLPKNVAAYSGDISKASDQLSKGQWDEAVGTVLELSKALDTDIFKRAIWVSMLYNNLDSNLEEGVFAEKDIDSYRKEYHNQMFNLIEELKNPDKYGQAL